MKNEEKTKELLIQELVELRQRVAEVEASETSYKLMGEELEAEKSKVDSIVNSITSGIDIVSYDYAVQYQNKFLLDRFGDIRGKLCYKEYMNRDKPCSGCPMRRAIESNKAERTELIGADGRDYELLATPIQNPDGTMSAVEAAVDITERKRAEEKIGELSSAVAQSIDGIAIGDLEPQLTYVNDAFARMHGYSPEEMTGMKVVDLHNEEQMDQYERDMSQMKTRGYWTGEIGHIRKDGTPFPTYMSVTLLQDEKGKPIGILAVCRDITERKRAEEVLRESEEKYRSLFENANEAIFIADTRTNIILDVNRQAEELIGRPREEIIGMHQSKLHPPHRAQYYKDRFREHVQKGQVFDLEAEVIAEDGRIVPVIICSSVIRVHGKDVIQGLFRDISEEKMILELREELTTRKLIEKAKGILMDRHRISEEEAIKRLQKESRRQRKKLKEIAQAVISSEVILG